MKLNTCALLRSSPEMTVTELQEKIIRLEEQRRSYYQLLMKTRNDPNFSKLDEKTQSEIIRKTWG